MISKDTTAKEVVIQAIREFALTAVADAYSLCEVSVTPEGVIKQRRLPDQLSKLADRIQLSGRYGWVGRLITSISTADFFYRLSSCVFFELMVNLLDYLHQASQTWTCYLMEILRQIYPHGDVILLPSCLFTHFRSCCHLVSETHNCTSITMHIIYNICNASFYILSWGLNRIVVLSYERDIQSIQLLLDLDVNPVSLFQVLS